MGDRERQDRTGQESEAQLVAAPAAGAGNRCWSSFFTAGIEFSSLQSGSDTFWLVFPVLVKHALRVYNVMSEAGGKCQHFFQPLALGEGTT
ncbi:hypothetical protein E4U42_001484, partial [Claviceps africana]